VCLADQLAIGWVFAVVTGGKLNAIALQPIAEAQNAQTLLGEVYRWYWADRPRARALYNQFREEFQFNLESTTKSEPLMVEAVPHIIIEEGASNTTPATRRKRSQKLLEEGRKHFRALDEKGKLRCQACGFVTPDGLETFVFRGT
jgi:hypothetical protein